MQHSESINKFFTIHHQNTNNYASLDYNPRNDLPNAPNAEFKEQNIYLSVYTMQY